MPKSGTTFTAAHPVESFMNGLIYQSLCWKICLTIGHGQFGLSYLPFPGVWARVTLYTPRGFHWTSFLACSWDAPKFQLFITVPDPSSPHLISLVPVLTHPHFTKHNVFYFPFPGRFMCFLVEPSLLLSFSGTMDYSTVKQKEQCKEPKGCFLEKKLTQEGQTCIQTN